MRRPLVLLHGWGVNSMIWDRIMPRLANDFELTVIDLPGYGNDTRYSGGYRLEELVDVVLSRAPHRANWVGWSLGATIALAAAIAQPARFLKLQLISATPCFLNRADWQHGVDIGPFESLAAEFERDYEKAVKKFLLLQVLTRNRAQMKPSKSLVRALTPSLTQSPRPSSQTLQQGLQILASTDLRAQLCQLPIETQVIAGASDHVVPVAASEYLFGQLPHGHSLNIFETGHLPFLEAPDKYIGSLNFFTTATQ